MFFGIDLGTTNSVIEYWVRTGDTFDIKPVLNNKGHIMTPSVVYFEEGKDQPVVGQTSLDHFEFEPDRTFRWVKRNMGKPVEYIVDGRTYTPQIISAYILKALKSNAEKELSQTIDEIVITVPADFDLNAKQATIDAGKIAGFSTIHLIPEPNSAILNYVFHKQQLGRLPDLIDYTEKYFAVFDLGGGTFDISLSSICLGSNGKPDISVISSSGDKYLGGINFDLDLMSYVLKKAIKIYPKEKESLETLLAYSKYYLSDQVSMSEEIKATLARLSRECEVGKIALSDEEKRTFSFVSHVGRTIRVEVSRYEFEEILTPYFDRIRGYIASVLRDAYEKTRGVISSWTDIAGVLLVGGSTNIPAVKYFCKEVFNQEPIYGLHTFECVARGAAIYSGVKNGNTDMFGSYNVITPHDYGIIVDNHFKPILLRGSSNKVAQYKYMVPFALDENAPIRVVQKYYDDKGEEILLDIEKINYSHPFLYSGDTLDITFSLNEDLILEVKLREDCINDTLEVHPQHYIKLSSSQIVDAQKLVNY